MRILKFSNPQGFLPVDRSISGCLIVFLRVSVQVRKNILPPEKRFESSRVPHMEFRWVACSRRGRPLLNPGACQPSRSLSTQKQCKRDEMQNQTLRRCGEEQ